MDVHAGKTLSLIDMGKLQRLSILYIGISITIIVEALVSKEDNIMLKEKEKDLLMGLILGDGSIYKDRRCNSYELYIGHGEKQRDYLEWKLNILNNSGIFKNKIKEKSKIVKLKGKEFLQFYFTKCSKITKEIYDLYYKDEVVNIDSILKTIKSDRSLAIWFMDDGSIYKRKNKKKDGTITWIRPSLKLCTHCFSYEDNLKIVQWFKNRYFVDCYIVSETKRNREGQPVYYYLNFNGENTDKIYKIIKSYITKCKSMEEKFEFLTKYYN